MILLLISTAKKSYAQEVNDMCQWGCQLCKEDGGTNPLCRIILEEWHSFCDDTKTLKKSGKELTTDADKTKDIIPDKNNDDPKNILDELLQAVWSEWFLYKVAPEVQNFENSIFDYKIGYLDNNRHRQIGIKMAQQFSIFWITPLNCGWQNT